MIDRAFLLDGAKRLRAIAVRRANYAATHSNTSADEMEESDFMRIFADSVREALSMGKSISLFAQESLPLGKPEGGE